MSPSLEAIESSSGGGADLLCGRCCRKTAEDVSKLCVCGTPLHPSCGDDVAVRECELTYGFPEPNGFCSKRCYESDLLTHQSMPQQQQQLQQQQLQQQTQQQQQFVVDPRLSAQLNQSHVDHNQLHLQQQQLQQPPPKRLSHVPNEITAVLTVKIGDAGKTSRRHLSVSTFRFLLSEGFEVFKAKANSRTTKELQQHSAGVAETFVRDDRAIYIKPGVHSKQAELVQLTEKNFDARIARSFRNFLKRKTTTGSASGHNSSSDPTEFACDILTYVRKDTSRRRPTAGVSGNGSKQPHASAVKSTSQLHCLMEYTDQQQQQQQTAALAMDAHLHASAMAMSTANSAGATGNFAASLASTISSGHKRKHSQTLLTDSSSAARSDALSGATSTSALVDADGPGAYKTIRMVLNGAVVPVQVNVRDLLACFGIASASHASSAPDDAGMTLQDL